MTFPMLKVDNIFLTLGRLITQSGDWSMALARVLPGAGPGLVEGAWCLSQVSERGLGHQPNSGQCAPVPPWPCVCYGRRSQGTNCAAVWASKSKPASLLASVGRDTGLQSSSSDDSLQLEAEPGLPCDQPAKPGPSAGAWASSEPGVGQVPAQDFLLRMVVADGPVLPL